MKKLEVASHISLIAAVLVFIGTTASDHLKGGSERQSRYNKGVEHISSNALSAEKKTLIIALSSHCRFCVASTPFYQALSGLRNAGKVTVKLVVVSPESLKTTEVFLHDNQIGADQIVSEPLQDLGVEGTPTLLLVKQGGDVEKRWDGQLSSAGQSQVVSAIE